MKYLSLFVFFFLIMSCKAQTQNGKFIGDSFDDTEPISLDIAINDRLDQPVAVKAKVNAVCQAKGCWMTLTDADAEVFVKFKDYGFFMPLDLAGAEVVAHGIISKTSTSVEELRHYAEDAGKSKDEIMAINQPKEEYKMMSDGVVILN